MIRQVYLDFIKDKISNKELGWILKRAIQYVLTHASFLLGKPLCGPILGTLVVTYKCNYHCKMCDLPLRDEQLQKQGLKELSTPELKQILRDFAGLGISGVGFTGGEPLLRSDIFELLKYTKDLGMITHLNTNGFLLNEENIKKILNAKIDSINISLDGANAQTHDAIRRHPGAFDKAIAAIECIKVMRKETGIPIRLKIVAVINEANIDEVGDLVKLSNDLGTDCIEFIPQQRFFESSQPGRLCFDDIFLKKLQKATGYLLKLKRQGVKIENSPRHIKLFKGAFKNDKSPLVCYAGYNSYAVDCYGEIYPCLPWVNWGKSAGNIKNAALKKFWYSSKYNKIRNDILNCRDCYLNCQSELNLLFNIK
ncbi:MAG: radical SAM protein [Candidatus Omnitrophota bacterium]